MSLIPNQRVAMYGLTPGTTDAWTALSAGDSALLGVETRLMKFNAPNDMPADPTSEANVTADLVTLTGFTSTARRLQFIWHGAGITGPDTQGTQAFFGECANGALITINAGDTATAAARLTYTDLTGGGSSSSGTIDRFMVSKSAPVLEITTSAAITDVYLVGVTNELTATHLDKFLPCWLEVRAIG